MRPLPSRRSHRFLLLTALISIGVAATCLAGAELPTGTIGAEAEALADRMLAAVADDAWSRTGAVRWTFRGKHQHLWDRQRNLARVRWDDYEVLVDLAQRTGIVRQKGQVLDGPDVGGLIEQAWAYWANDAFWLNPIAKLRDPGTERSLVAPDRKGRRRLLVTYTTGGVTPGDHYLWTLGDDDLPVDWRMWVQIIPKGGTRATWTGWQTLATGARVATEHRIAGLLKLRLTDVAGAATLAALEPGPDPFAELVR